MMKTSSYHLRAKSGPKLHFSYYICAQQRICQYNQQGVVGASRRGEVYADTAFKGSIL